MTLTLALSRTLNPADYEHLLLELGVVDRSGGSNRHQPHHRWEYALALNALGRKVSTGDRLDGPLYDVGAVSAFPTMLDQWANRSVLHLDPDELVDACVPGARLASAITCLSVLEHVEDLDRFCYHLGCLLAPGGLLVLTVPYWPKCGKDTAWNAALRQRIFCPRTYASLRHALAARSLHTFGLVDMTYHGAQVHDYTLASLVLEKRP